MDLVFLGMPWYFIFQRMNSFVVQGFSAEEDCPLHHIKIADSWEKTCVFLATLQGHSPRTRGQTPTRNQYLRQGYVYLRQECVPLTRVPKVAPSICPTSKNPNVLSVLPAIRQGLRPLYIKRAEGGGVTLVDQETPLMF